MKITFLKYVLYLIITLVILCQLGAEIIDVSQFGNMSKKSRNKNTWKKGFVLFVSFSLVSSEWRGWFVCDILLLLFFRTRIPCIVRWNVEGRILRRVIWPREILDSGRVWDCQGDMVRRISWYPLCHRVGGFIYVRTNIFQKDVFCQSVMEKGEWLFYESLTFLILKVVFC